MRTIDIVAPHIIVSLGRQALATLSITEQHRLELKSHVWQVVGWSGIRLMPLYHPSQQVCNIHHRRRADVKPEGLN